MDRAVVESIESGVQPGAEFDDGSGGMSRKNRAPSRREIADRSTDPTTTGRRIG